MNADRRDGAFSLLLAGWLVVLWVVLWGDVSLANVVGGLVVALPVARYAGRSTEPGSLRIRPLAAGRFVAVVLWMLVLSTIEVAGAVFRTSRVRSAVVGVSLRTSAPAVVTAVANAVTLTPGTTSLAVEGEPPVLYVHALLYSDRESVVADVRRLEDLAARAAGVRLAAP